jgi:hypothetical protein
VGQDLKPLTVASDAKPPSKTLTVGMAPDAARAIARFLDQTRLR